MRLLTLVAAAVVVNVLLPAAAVQNQGFLGRWNLTGTGQDANRVYWLEVTEKGGQLSGMFLNRGGNPVPLASVTVQGKELVFQLAPGTNKQPGAEFRAKLDGGKLVGTTKAADRTINFVGVRPPKWPASNANAKHTYGKPVELFDGKSADGLRQAAEQLPGHVDRRGRRPHQRAADPEPDVEAEVLELPPSGRVQAHREEQQRHLPARPLRAAGARRLRHAAGQSRPHVDLRVDGAARQREQAGRRMADGRHRDRRQPRHRHA